MKKLSYDVIVAAVGGDEEAMGKVLKHYEPMIRQMSMGNADLRQHLIAELRESILHYNLEDPQQNEAYLRQKYPQEYASERLAGIIQS